MSNRKKLPTSPPADMGENIRKWRELRCIKQQLLAARLGITAGAMSNIENNKSGVSTDRLQQIATCLEIDVRLLFSNPLDLIASRARAR